MNGKPLSPNETRILRESYADTSTPQLAKRMGCSMARVYAAAKRLGLHKSAAYMASPQACRLRRGDNVGKAFRFKPGQVPPNKGLRRPGWSPGRMAETQFKPGARTGKAAQNWRPIGTILADHEGYLRIKLREGKKGEASGFGNTKIWPLLHRHVWEQHKGPIPPGHSVVFRDSDRGNVAIDNLECISRADLMRRNTIHNLPKDLADLIQLNGALKRQLRKREKCEEQNDRSSQPSV